MMSPNRMAVLCLALATLNLANAFATDRQSPMIDSIGMEMVRFDDGKMLTGVLNGETDLPGAILNLALLAELGFGKVTLDNNENGSLWNAGLGLKYYSTPACSLSVLASFGELSLDQDSGIAALSALAKYRMLPADDTLSPYLLAGLALRGMDEPWWPSNAIDDITELQLTAGAGCDVEFKPGMALIVQATYSTSEELAGNDSSPDMLSAIVGIKGYLK